MNKICESKNVCHAEDDELKRIESANETIEAWHGTNKFWALWFCLYGIDGKASPPTKTLGRGSMAAGFTKIQDPGLYVSPRPLAGFPCQVALDVKPSELGLSVEMASLGYTNALKALSLSECIVTKKLPPQRVTSVTMDGKKFGRKEFLRLFDDPIAYISENLDRNMYHSDDNELLKAAKLNILFSEFKQSGDSPEEMVAAIQDMIRHKDYVAFGLGEGDMLKLLDWAKAKERKHEQVH